MDVPFVPGHLQLRLVQDEEGMAAYRAAVQEGEGTMCMTGRSSDALNVAYVDQVIGFGSLFHMCE